MKSVGLFCLSFVFGATLAAAQPLEGDGQLAAPPTEETQATVFPVVGYLTPTGSPAYGPLLAARSRLVAVSDPMAGDHDLGQFLIADSLRQSEIYSGTVAAIDTRLQLGALPMSPILVVQWNEAQAAVDQIEINGSQLTAEAPVWPAYAAQLEALGGELAQLSQELELDGMDAINFNQLRGDVQTLSLFTEAWQTKLSTHLEDQSGRVATWRADLAALKERIIEGNDQPATGSIGQADVTGRPLPIFAVTFDRPGVLFEDQLETLIADLARSQPDYQLDIVAVAEKNKDPERQEILQEEALQFTQSVIRALRRLGVEEDRFSFTDAVLETRIGSEVRIFLTEDEPDEKLGEAPLESDADPNAPPG